MKIFESKKHHEATRSLAAKIGLLLNTAAMFKTLPVLLREKNKCAIQSHTGNL